ncbi:MAG: ribonuclease HII [Bdellovibrionales bacterium]|nr:ribonuclease HII [Bdellovibrionales bacterium]
MKRLQLVNLPKKLSFNSLQKKFNWKELVPQPVIGVDEVGRGCLAGPVYAAAVILNESVARSHYTDSKLLSASRRLELSEEIKALHRVGIGFASVEEIEQINILQAALLAMKRAVLNLSLNFGHLVVDGNQKIPGLGQFSQTTLIKGDLRAEPVAAASIVAKVARDQLLTELELEFPQYGFSRHKGYSTAAHKAAIAQFGPCPIHRRTFAGVREFCEAEK